MWAVFPHFVCPRSVLRLLRAGLAAVPIFATAPTVWAKTEPVQGFTIVLPDTPPFVIKQGDAFTGLGMDILHKISQQSGIKFRPQIASIPRMRQLILHQQTDLALFIPMRWTEGIMHTGQPIFCFSITLYSLKKNPVRNLQDLKGRDLASLPGGMFFSRLREKTGVNFIAAKGDTIMARLLIGERVDAVVMGSHFARLLFDTERKRQGRTETQLAPPLYLWTQPYAILSNPQRVAPAIQEAINRAVIKLRNNNTFDTLLRKHGAEQRPCPKRSAAIRK